MLYTSTRRGLVSWNRLAFWKRDDNVSRPSGGRTRRWAARDTQGHEMVNFDSPQMTRPASKTSASSIAGLKEEMLRGAGQNSLEGVESDMLDGRL